MPAIIFPPSSPTQIPGPPVIPRKRVAVFNRALAMGSNSNGGGSSDSNYTTARGQISVRNLNVAVANPRIWLANWTLTGGGVEMIGANSFTATAALQYPYGYFTQITFNGGQTSVVVPPGATVPSDPIPITIAANTLAYFRHFISVASGGTWPRGQTVVTSLSEGADEGVGLTDNTMSGAAYNGSNLNYNGFGIHAIDGFPLTPNPSCCIVGDSISWGQGDDPTGVATAPSGDGLGNYGFIQRTLYNAGIGYHKMVKSGLYARDVSAPTPLLPTVGCRTRAIAEFAGTAHVLLGTNDLSYGGITFASLSGYLLTICQSLSALGLRVIVGTPPPHTTSTDGWATAGNQSFYNSSYGGSGTTYQQYCDYIRSLPGVANSGVFAVADYSDACSTLRNSGIWKSLYTSDGTHPNQANGMPAMQAVLQAAVNAGVFV